MGKRSLLSYLEDEIGAGPLVEALFWIPTRMDQSQIDLMPNPLPGTDTSIKTSYLDGVVNSPAIQISIAPPLFQFTVRAPFRASRRINSELTEHRVKVFVYGLIKDYKHFANLKGNNKITLKGFLRSNGEDDPQIELHGATPVSEEELRKFEAVYSAKGNGAPKDLQAAIFNALQVSIPDAVKLLKKHLEITDTRRLVALMNLGLDGVQFKSLDEFFWALHLPEGEFQFDAAKQAAKNLGVGELMRRAHRASYRPEHPESIINLTREQTNQYLSSMHIVPTKDQVNAMIDIFRDLVSPFAMRRLLSGDVGTGKTAVFGIKAAATQGAGKTVAIFIPNSILAHQVASDMQRWWPDTPIKLVTASQKPTKAELLENPILIGTSALLNFWRKHMEKEPHLLIVDEQQKSSREQREFLLGDHTNFLEATATCLPRTMGLAVHGSLNISVVSQQPVPKTITSKIIQGADEKASAYEEIKALVKRGERCAIVLPMVEARLTGDPQEDAENQKKSVVDALPVWEAQFSGQVIGIHGRLSESEKIKGLNDVKAGKFPIVLATSLIEIGVTIPKLTLVLVIHPQNYGASSLHQLRGRLVREGGEGKFYLILDDKGTSEKTMARLEAVCSTSNGFELAEKDFEQRGFGDLGEDSSDQSGAPICLFKNICIYPGDVTNVVQHFQNEKTTANAKEAVGKI